MPGKQFENIDQTLTAIAVNYKIDALIGSEVAPVTSVPGADFKYPKWKKNEVFTIPDTVLSKTGEYPQIEFTSTLESASVENRGLATNVAVEDIQAQENSGNKTFLMAIVEKLVDVMLLRKEVQIAKTIQDKSNYGSNVKTYTAANSWKNEDVDPLEEISNAMGNALVPLNRLWIAQDAFQILKRNKNAAAYFTVSGQKINITPELLAQELGLDKVVIGRTSYNTGKSGESMKIENAWRAKAGLYLYQPAPTASMAQSFAIDAYHKPNGNIRDVSVIFIEDRGRSGVQKIYIGETSKVLTTSEDYGYLFEGVSL